MSDFALIGFLRTCPYQPVLGMVLGIAGLFSIIDGAGFFQIFCVSVFAAAAGTCVFTEMTAFGKDLGLWVNIASGLEAALVTAIACYYGLDGLQIIAGSLLGLAVAYATYGHFMELRNAPQSSLLEVAWYAGAALIGAVSLLFGDKHAHAVVGPLTGGLLFASLTVYLAAFVVASSDASSAKFIDFVEALLSGRGALDMFGQQATAAWIVGGCVWMVVLLLGLSRHFLLWWRCKSDSNSRSQRNSSRSDRTDPLLPSSRSVRSGSNRYDEDGVPLGRPEGRSSGRSKSGGGSRSRENPGNMYG